MKLIDENILRLVPMAELNGCGPKGFGGWVRDTWGKVSFQKVGSIHDSHFFLISEIYPAKTIATIKLEIIRKFYPEFWNALRTKKTAIAYANKVFYKNLKIINKEKSPTRFGYICRKPVIWLYYRAVVNFGRYFV
jgi:hypothetical protein